MERNVVFDWSEFEANDLNSMYYETRKLPYDESLIYGCIYATVDDIQFIIDISYDKWAYDDQGITLEVYLEKDGGHGEWIDGLRHIMRNAKNYKRFQNRAETAVKEFVSHLDLNKLKQIA